MRRVQAILPLLCQIYAENDQNVVYNEGVQFANVATRNLVTLLPYDDSSPEENPWVSLNKQGQFARGSVLPADDSKGELKLVGGFEIFQEGGSDDNIYGCNLEDFGNSTKIEELWAGKFAILYRGKCKFEEKIKNAAHAGAKGVIVVNNQPDGVITMSIGGAKEDNLISLMITHNDGKNILIQMQQNNGTQEVRITKGEPQVGFEKVIVIVICLAFLVLLTISLAWVIFYYVQRFRILHRQYTAQKRQERLMRKALDSLKVETLKESSELVKNHEETCCAICIDNFEAGTEVRHLTCGHPYHKKCIDPWLMEKGTCPQCKVDVLKQLGLRDSETYADPPTDEESPPHVETNEAYDEDFSVSEHPVSDEMNDSGVEDSNIDHNETEGGEECSGSQFTWFAHSQLDRAMSEPLPPVNQTSMARRSVIFRNSILSTENVNEVDERSQGGPATEF